MIYLTSHVILPQNLSTDEIIFLEPFVKRTASKLKAICHKMVSFRVVSVLIFGVIELAHCRYYEMNEPKQKWDYVTVRQDAHMFWWVYYTTALESYQNRPLVIWLQVKTMNFVL